MIALPSLAVALLASPLPDLDPVSLVDATPTVEARIGVDGSGHAYDAYSVSYPTATYIGFRCYLESAPETQIEVMYGTSTMPSSMGSIVIAREGDGVFVPPSSWFSCRDALAGGAQTASPIVGLPANSSNIIVSPDGMRVCAATIDRASGDDLFVDCLRRVGNGVVERWADSTTWDAALGVVPFEDLNPSGIDRPTFSCGLQVCPQVYEGWALGQMLFSPDGEQIYLRVDRRTILPGTTGEAYHHGVYGWLLVVSPGEVHARVSPSLPLRDSAADGGIAGANALVYEPTLDAMLIGPFDSEWGSDIIRLGSDGAGNVISGPRGFGGTVYLALPLHEAGLGTLSLTNAVIASGAVNPVLRGERDGVYFASATGRQRLVIDVERLDLDGDGLVREIEDDLGTSDWRVSSDGAVSSDSIELMLGTDPLDPSDDTGSRLVPRETLGLSSLWELHQPPLGGQMVRSFGKHGPMCAAGRCWSADGVEVGGYDATKDAVVGVDGKSVGWVDGGAAVFVDLASGEATRFEGDYTTVVPLDAGRGFAIDTRDEHMRVDWLADGEAQETLFELAGVAMVDADDVRDQVRGRMKVVGYLEKTGALFVSVETTWRTFIWALRPGEAPYPVAKLTGADAVYPDAFVLWGDGVAYGYASRSDGLGGRSYGSMLTPEAELIDSETFDREFFGTANAAWGGVFVQVFGGGTHELVRVPEQAVPGEIYAYGTWGEGSGILRGVPRGGLVALEPLGVVQSPVAGLGVNALHHLCVAEPAMGVRELGPVASGGAPEGEIARYELRGAKDCVYDTAGGLWVLLAPTEEVPDVVPSVWFRVARGQALVSREDVVIGDAPLHFDERTGFVGTPTILDRSEACGRMTTRAGHEVVVDCDGQLSWDGRVLGLNPGGTPVTFAGEAMLAERPDGRIVATGSSLRVPVAIDVPTLRVVPYVSGNWGTGLALAILPGGAAVDPWTGKSLPTIQPPPPDVGWQAPTPVGPADALAGEVVEAEEPGCSGSNVRAWWFLGALLVWVRRLRRA